MINETIDYILSEIDFLSQLENFIYKNLKPEDAMRVREGMNKRITFLESKVFKRITSQNRRKEKQNGK